MNVANVLRKQLTIFFLRSRINPNHFLLKWILQLRSIVLVYHINTSLRGLWVQFTHLLSDAKQANVLVLNESKCFGVFESTQENSLELFVLLRRQSTAVAKLYQKFCNTDCKTQLMARDAPYAVRVQHCGLNNTRSYRCNCLTQQVIVMVLFTACATV